MTAPMCRCGTEKWQHERLASNSYSPPCRDYRPMDFEPFLRDITGCCCDLCNALAHAVSLPQGDWVPRSNTLFDALVAGTHVYRSHDEWAEKLRADGTDGPGYQSSGGFMKSGLGLGLTPGGVTGAVR